MGSIGALRGGSGKYGGNNIHPGNTGMRDIDLIKTKTCFPLNKKDCNSKTYESDVRL